MAAVSTLNMFCGEQEQVRSIQEDHSREVNQLHMKLNQTESECFSLERQLQQTSHTNSSSCTASLSP